MATAVKRTESQLYSGEDPTDVGELARTMSKEVLECRDSGHQWDHYTAGRDADNPGGYTRVKRCRRCEALRTERLTNRGKIWGGRKYEYPDDYLIAGLGRITGEGRDMLRLVSTLTLAGMMDELNGQKSKGRRKVKATA